MPGMHYCGAFFLYRFFQTLAEAPVLNHGDQRVAWDFALPDAGNNITYYAYSHHFSKNPSY
jgi:hypothetical protein